MLNKERAQTIMFLMVSLYKSIEETRNYYWKNIYNTKLSKEIDTKCYSLLSGIGIRGDLLLTAIDEYILQEEEEK
jgi:hypothetical protein